MLATCEQPTTRQAKARARTRRQESESSKHRLEFRRCAAARMPKGEDLDCRFGSYAVVKMIMDPSKMNASHACEPCVIARAPIAGWEAMSWSARSSSVTSGAVGRFAVHHSAASAIARPALLTMRTVSEALRKTESAEEVERR